MSLLEYQFVSYCLLKTKTPFCCCCFFNLFLKTVQGWAWVRFPDPASYVGRVCCWFSSLQCLLKILKRTFRGTKILFCVGGLNLFFSPRRYQLQNNTSSTVIFSAQSPKRYYKISSCGLFEAEHPRGSKTTLLSLKGTMSTPAIFTWGLPPPPLGINHS